MGYVSSADGRDNRRIQFEGVCERHLCAQVGSCIYLPLGCADASGRYRTKQTV